MINLDNIKNEWKNLSVKDEWLTDKNRELASKLASERASNYQQKLSRSYRIGFVGFAFPFLAVTMRHAFDASIMLCVIYSLFGLAVGGYDLWFMHFISKSDYVSMPTVEAMSHASKVVKYQNRATVISILAMIMVLIPLFYEMCKFGDYSIVYGGVAGLIIGLILGIRKCIINHRNAKRMLSELKDIDDKM